MVTKQICKCNTSNMLDSLALQNESSSVTSTYNANEDYGDSWDLTTKCLVGIPLVIIIFMAITGNLLVCLAIYTDRRLRKLGNLFLVSLALADLFVSSLVMTFAVPNDLMGYWMFGPQFCDTWVAFDVMCSTASILNLCAISLDRFIHIKDPLRYGRWMTKRVVLMAIAGIWLTSALVSFLPISLGWHKPKKVTESADEDLWPTCALDLTPVYAVVSSIISFYAPCVVMVALYTRLYLYARKHVRNIRAVTRTTVKNSSGSKSCSTNHQNHHHNMDHKAAITLGFIMGTFLVCWVPFFCINIVAAVCKSCISDMVFKFLTWLGYCNSALNPIIYSIFNTEFREAFRKIIFTYLQAECCSSCCKNSYRDRSDTRRTTLGFGNSNNHFPPSSPLNPDPINRIEMQGEWSGKSSDV